MFIFACFKLGFNSFYLLLDLSANCELLCYGLQRVYCGFNTNLITLYFAVVLHAPLQADSAALSNKLNELNPSLKHV